MLELLGKLKGDELLFAIFVMIAGGVGLLMGLTTLIAQNLRRYHERQLVTSLILEMLDRGMPTDDIVRVLSAADLKDENDEISAWQQRLGGRLRQKLARRWGSEPTSPAPKA